MGKFVKAKPSLHETMAAAELAYFLAPTHEAGKQAIYRVINNHMPKVSKGMRVYLRTFLCHTDPIKLIEGTWEQCDVSNLSPHMLDLAQKARGDKRIRRSVLDYMAQLKERGTAPAVELAQQMKAVMESKDGKREEGAGSGSQALAGADRQHDAVRSTVSVPKGGRAA